MTAEPRRRLDDVGAGAAGIAALVASIAMLVSSEWRVEPDGHELALVESWSAVVERFGWPAAGPVQPLLVALTAMLASAIVVALSLRPPRLPAVRRLRRALLLGSVAALYYFDLRLTDEFGGALRSVADVATHAMGAWALAELAAFLASYPRSPDESTLRQFLRNELGTGRSDAQLDRLAALKAKQVRALAGRPVAAAWASLGVIAGVCFVMGDTRPTLEVVAVSLSGAGLLLPIFGVEALRVNYVYGTDDERRRIAAIYFGPVAGFLLGTAAWAGSLMWFLGTADVATAYANPAHAAFALSTLLFFSVLAVGVVVGLAIAIFHRGSFDPRLAIRRSAVVTLSGLLVTAIFVAVEGAISSQIVLRSGLPDHSGAVVAGTLAALFFAPVRRRIDATIGRAVDRFMPAAAIADGDVVRTSVCFVDLCGYTALSATDQSLAVLHAGLLHKCARAAAAVGGGQLVKTLGDAVMLRWPDPEAAAAGVRRIAADYRSGAAALEIAALPLHAGLHHGEAIVARDGDLFGTTVNVAARLLGAAGEHQLLLSGDAFAAATPEAARSNGPLALKNIAGPVPSYVIDLAG